MSDQFPFQGEQPNKGWVLGDKQPIPYPGEHKCLIPSELKTCYPLIISAMVPRPIALVSSMSASGVGTLPSLGSTLCGALRTAVTLGPRASPCHVLLS
jgi:hypothetical protein